MKFGLLTLFDHYTEDCSEEQYYKNFFEEVDHAEKLGFDSIWLGEHHFCRYICPAPQIVAAAVAQRTKKMRIGTAIVLLPHHDPIRLAEDYALVDLLSGGRLDFGVGRGFIKATYDGFNQSMGESRERFNESLELIERAWQQPTFSYAGRFYQVQNVSVLPRPLQKPSPPVFMAAAVSPESFVAAGEKGHSILLAPFIQSRGALQENVQLYKETLTSSGYSPQNVDIVAGYHTFVDDTPDLACEKWRSHYLRYMHFVGSLITPEEYTTPQYEAWRRSGEALRQITWDRMYPTQVLCGDPAQCIERIGLMQEQFGVTHFWVYMDLGGLEQRKVLQSIEKFATQVISRFR